MWRLFFVKDAGRQHFPRKEVLVCCYCTLFTGPSEYLFSYRSCPKVYFSTLIAGLPKVAGYPDRGDQVYLNFITVSELSDKYKNSPYIHSF